MALKINNNSDSLFALTRLQKNFNNVAASLAKISSGQRINKAADDASSMIIADMLDSQQRGYGQGIANAIDAISMVQTADEALGQMTENLQDIRLKALQAGSPAQSSESRQAIQTEISRSLEAFDSIARNTSYNGKELLTGNFTGKAFQVGAVSGETINVDIGAFTSDKLGGTAGNDQTGTVSVLSDIDVTSGQGAQDAIAIVDRALEQVSQGRSDLGSTQNQLSSAIANLSTSQVNAASARSTIQDIDFADEAAVLSNSKILLRANIFAMTQADKVKEKNILNLLQG